MKTVLTPFSFSWVLFFIHPPSTSLISQQQKTHYTSVAPNNNIEKNLENFFFLIFEKIAKISPLVTDRVFHIKNPYSSFDFSSSFFFFHPRNIFFFQMYFRSMDSFIDMDLLLGYGLEFAFKMGWIFFWEIRILL